MQVRILRVLTLPVNPLPDTFYYVKNGNRADVYLTNNQGEVFPVSNTEVIVQLIGELAVEGGDPGDISVYFDNALI